MLNEKFVYSVIMKKQKDYISINVILENFYIINNFGDCLPAIINVDVFANNELIHRERIRGKCTKEYFKEITSIKCKSIKNIRVKLTDKEG